MSTFLLSIQIVRPDNYTVVRPSTISQDVRKSKDTLKNNNMLNSNKNKNTHQIIILSQAMRSRQISNLMTRKASLPEMMSQLKM